MTPKSSLDPSAQYNYLAQSLGQESKVQERELCAGKFSACMCTTKQVLLQQYPANTTGIDQPVTVLLQT